MDKISFIEKLSLLSKAIADNDQATPGYMYTEISKISYESGSQCQDLLGYLVDNLSSKSCHVRLKVLKILHYVTIHGHRDFKEGLRKRSLGITDSLQFSGPADPLHGMQNYLKVRQEAAALSATLFEIDENEAKSQGHPEIEKKVMMGMGNTGGKSQGFGNTQPKPKSIGGNLVTSVLGFAEKVLSPPHSAPNVELSFRDKRFGEYQAASMTCSLVDTALATSSSNSSSSPFQLLSQSSLQSDSSCSKLHKSTGRKKGVPGGGWADPVEHYDSESSSNKCSITSDGNLERSDTDVTIDTEDLSSRLQEIRNEANWSTENTLVSDLVSDSENFSISHSELKTFIKDCSVVNCEYVLKLINLKLQSSEENIQMRCMLALEGLLRTDYVSADQVVLICSNCLLNLYINNTGKVKAKARKVIRILEKLSSTSELLSAEINETASCSMDILANG